MCKNGTDPATLVFEGREKHMRSSVHLLAHMSTPHRDQHMKTLIDFTLYALLRRLFLPITTPYTDRYFKGNEWMLFSWTLCNLKRIE